MRQALALLLAACTVERGFIIPDRVAGQAGPRSPHRWAVGRTLVDMPPTERVPTKTDRARHQLADRLRATLAADSAAGDPDFIVDVRVDVYELASTNFWFLGAFLVEVAIVAAGGLFGYYVQRQRSAEPLWGVLAGGSVAFVPASVAGSLLPMLSWRGVLRASLEILRASDQVPLAHVETSAEWQGDFPAPPVPNELDRVSGAAVAQLESQLLDALQLHLARLDSPRR